MGVVRAAGAQAAARLTARACRIAGRGATSLPGKVLLRLDPAAIGDLARRLPDGSIVISATNGKTTTAAMTAAILEADGRSAVHNRSGANMAGGIATTLLDARGDIGLLEVDEFWLDGVAAALKPRVTVLGNLFRDQLDRYGELEAIAQRWRVLAQSTVGQLVLNADDPAIAALGRGASSPIYFGVDDSRIGLDAAPHASDATHCGTCGTPFVYERRYLGHLGIYRCDVCATRRPAPSVVAQEVQLDGVSGSRFELVIDRTASIVELPLPGLYNVYNALGAAAAAHALGISMSTIVVGLEAVRPAFGRGESVAIAGRALKILLVKNPAGANEVLRTLSLEGGPLDLLAVLNDQIADGRDVSWIWDADFEGLAPTIGHATCAGTRAAEMALRLKYAGVAPSRITVCEDLPAALGAALDAGMGPLYAMPTYTAMLELRRELVRRGAAGDSFA